MKVYSILMTDFYYYYFFFGSGMECMSNTLKSMMGYNLLHDPKYEMNAFVHYDNMYNFYFAHLFYSH